MVVVGRGIALDAMLISWYDEESRTVFLYCGVDVDRRERRCQMCWEGQVVFVVLLEGKKGYLEDEEASNI